MKLALLILLIVPTTAPRTAFVHTRERIDSQSWVDSVSITPETYIDLRYDYNPGGIAVTMLGCKVSSMLCDSPAQFRRMVEAVK
jgi:hypothetical protein